ncbi:PaaI family thioesterase [Sphingobium aromaticiconvertens]|uniref:PaaI family thioesterase n=1 Tax=Sphingobium aromaticiconvertens TaxID=365341 RepID=UPI00301AAECE
MSTGAVDASESGDGNPPPTGSWLTDADDAELLAHDARWTIRRRASAALRSLGYIVARGDLDVAALEAIEDVVERQLAAVAGVPDMGDRTEYMRASGIEGPRNRLALEMSAVAGRSNPSSLPLTLSYGDQNQLIGTFTPFACHEGPPGFLHGGLIAALFDEFLGLSQTELQRPPAMTGTLTVRYIKPTPLARPLHMTLSEIVSDGRKRFAKSELWAGAERTAICEAIFIETHDEASADG